MTDSLAPKQARFSISVPDPKTRLNLGKTDEKTKFGFSGASLETAANVWVSSKLNTQLEASGSIRLQAGNTYEQFSSGEMVMASFSSATVASMGKLILNSGGGQGATALGKNSGTNPPWQPFINLSLHYIADAVRSDLKSLFYGSNWKTHQRRNESQKKWFVAEDAVSEPLNGFLFEVSRLLDDAGFDRTDSDLAKQRGATLKPMMWRADCVASHQFARWNTSEYTFLNAVDPYAPTDVKGTSKLGKALNRTLHAYPTQLSNSLKRSADAAELLLPTIQFSDLAWRINVAIGGARTLATFIESKEWENLVVKRWQNVGAGFAPPADPPEDDGAGDVGSGSVPRPLTTGVAVDGAFPLVGKSGKLTVRTSDASAPIELDLSEFLPQAQLVLTLTEGVTKVRATVSSSADDIGPGGRPSLELDGATATYDAALRAWSLPAGFTATAEGVLAKSDGSPFQIGKANSVALVDLTFAEATATLSVDGTPIDVPLSSLSASSASGRAAALASALQGKAGATASASGPKVTVTSPTRGEGSSVGLLAQGLEALGLTGAAAAGAGSIPIEALRSKLAAVANLQVTTGGQPQVTALTLESTATKSPVLVFGGAGAKALFGADPTAAEMLPSESPKQAPSTTPGTDFIKKYGSWLSASQYQQYVQPYFDARRGLSTMYERIRTAATTLYRVLTGLRGQSPPSVGISAGLGGIQLATQGKMTAAAHSVSLIAMGHEGKGPDVRKAMIPEEVLLGLVSFLDNKWGELMDSKMGFWDPPLAAKGELNAIANGELRLIARDHLRLVSKESLKGVAQNIELRAVNDATLASNKLVHLMAPAIELGNVAEPAKGQPTTPKTTTLDVRATETLNLGIYPEAKKRTATLHLDAAKMSVLLAAGAKTSDTVADNKLRVALLGGSDEVQIASDKTLLTVTPNEATLAAKQSVKLAADGKTNLLAKSGKLHLYGAVDVGGALTVKGAAGASVNVASKLAQVDLTVQQLEVQRAAINAAVRALLGVLKTMGEAAEPIAEGVPPVAGLPILGASHRIKQNLEEQIHQLLTKDAKLRQQLAAAGAPPGAAAPLPDPLDGVDLVPL